jgi:hypothetical protein
MNKKAIASITLLVASMAIHAQVAEPQLETICIDVTKESDRSLIADGYVCNETRANEFFDRDLKKNGCAKNQVAIVSTQVKIPNCPLPMHL